MVENARLRENVLKLGAEVVEWQKKATETKRISIKRGGRIRDLEAEVESLKARVVELEWLSDD